ncbi:UDP-N-acetylmuramoylalanine--D-glutamate ligase [Kordiimonas sediminis]|uniref:UDP-N-acetylmuramoylalanine--D-glutamate ligase n=1 Tax=Kordiimonas sediminis TaxID=1735581 RepID=A0A919AR92_9PROT|nr:UDP-N-acetylmuramoyl-L-alanine--D-glutamate ligase [Kordiimonas sediminis]GHF23135.1 UDP-N-acetylmuramoylalanine--D-glutamate ligase [Kordiimonas sediminis]
MIVADTYRDKKVAVFGLARTGIAAVESLRAAGATVWAWDDAQDRVASVGTCAVDLYQADFKGLDALLLAPGVPLTHPNPHALVIKAKEAGVPCIADFDIFEAARPDLPAHQCIAITGTNGKSTTTALITHILQTAGVPSVMAGNIGTGVLSVEPLAAGGVYVFEMSSYQLDLIQGFSADVGVLLNISPDHLDRHGDMEGYVKAKARLFGLQQSMHGRAVIGVDDAYGKTLSETISVPVIRISADHTLEDGVYVDGGVLFDASEGDGVPIGDLVNAPALQGVHNAQNAAAAYAACKLVGLHSDAIYQGLCSFPGLVHRQELIAVKDGVSYVNDSKATNVDAAARALATYKNIHWIAGGRAKEKSLQGLMSYIGNVKTAYLIGEAQMQFAQELVGKVNVVSAGTLEGALTSARQAAVEGDCVLLSPACAAFDQFDNFEVRGDRFRSLVHECLGGQL